MAWSYVTTDVNGTPESIGIQMDENALKNLPKGHHSHGATEFMLKLPGEIAVAPYDHITLDWNEHGHPPMNVYDLPHFDLHFYFMSPSERDLIGPTDDAQFNKPMEPQFLAPEYLETPGGVPRMGAHIIDLLSPEVMGTGRFAYTFIYGKYDAKMNFLEPMVTREFLESKQSATYDIRHPQQWQTPGYYPSQYTIDYASDSNVYTIMLKGLKKF